jgi:fructose-1-phosphate kinase PfkB-like protein
VEVAQVTAAESSDEDVGQVAAEGAGDAAVGAAVAASAWRENTSKMVRIPAASSANCIAR